jgi:iron complex outermembrane receptor protein
MSKLSSFFSRIFVGACTPLLIGSILPWSVSAQTSVAAGNQETVRLDPFDVSATQPNGYAASTTFSGTGMNMPLKDVPMAITVITSEFLEDANLLNSFRVLDYVSSVTQGNRSDNGDQNQTFTIRGFYTSNYLVDGISATNYFPARLIDRVEVVKGPNTLYGQSDPGGLINRITKRAESTNFAKLTASYGSWNTFDEGFDVNRKITSQLNLRLLGDSNTTGGWRWIDGTESSFGAVIADWRPFSTTRISLMASYNGVSGQAANRAAFPFLSVVQDLNGNGTTTDTVGGVPESGVRYNSVGITPWEYTSEAANDFFHLHASYLRGSVEQQVGSHVTLLYSFARNNQGNGTNFREFNTFSNNGLTNTVNLSYGTYADVDAVHTVNTSFNFNTGPVKHILLLGYRYSQDSTVNYSWGLNNNTAAINAIAAKLGQTIRTNLTISDLIARVPIWKDYVPTSTEMMTYFPGGGGNIVTTQVKTAYVSDSVTLLGDRLRLLGGLRNVSITNFQRTSGGVYVPNATGANSRNNKDTSFQLGLNYRINDAVVPFANYATAFAPNGSFFDPVTKITSYYDPVRSTAWEAGVKFDKFFGDRVSGSISYFNILKHNVVAADYNPGTGGNFTDITDDRSKGVDMDLYYNITPDWQVVLGFTAMKAVVVKTATASLGLALEGAAPERGTLWTSYKVSTGPLKGLRFGGGGFKTFGTIQQFNTSGNRYINQKIYYELSAFARYDVKIARQNVSLGLNVANLTNQFYLRSRGNSDSPRSITLSVSTKF